MSYVPTFNINVPFGGPQGPPMTIPTHQPVYSSYTGNLVGYGPLPRGIICDAPSGHGNYGNAYHVVEYNPVNKSYMAHFDPGFSQYGWRR